jgi:hypothetical protein
VPILNLAFALFQSLYLTRRTLCEARFAFYIGLVYVRRLDDDPKSWIKLDNFYGIEIKAIGQEEAWRNVLPLHKTGQIHVDNALRLDWFKICPPAVQMEQQPTDLFDTERDQFRGERGGDLYLRRSAV